MGEVAFFEVGPGHSDFELIYQNIVDANYSDLPLILLLTFHLFWFGLFIWNRHRLLPATFHFFLSCYGIFVSNQLNRLLSAHWKELKFSRNYFDTNYMFIFTFWSLPLSISTSIMIVILFADLCKSLSVHRYFNSITKCEKETWMICHLRSMLPALA